MRALLIHYDNIFDDYFHKICFFFRKIAKNDLKICGTGKNRCISLIFCPLVRFEMYVEAEYSYLKLFEKYLKLGNFTTHYTVFSAYIFFWKFLDMAKKHPQSMWSCPTSKILYLTKSLDFNFKHMFESPSYDKNSQRYTYFYMFHFWSIFLPLK